MAEPPQQRAEQLAALRHVVPAHPAPAQLDAQPGVCRRPGELLAHPLRPHEAVGVAERPPGVLAPPPRHGPSHEHQRPASGIAPSGTSLSARLGDLDARRGASAVSPCRVGR
ncbi:MAG: hypothetical protein U0797_28495 [Gemmataceae bacterium]